MDQNNEGVNIEAIRATLAAEQEASYGFRILQGQNGEKELLVVSQKKKISPERRIAATDQSTQKLEIDRIVYVVSEASANRELQHIIGGVVGFDTEFTKRTPSRKEQLILNMKTPSSTAKKTAKAILQYLELVSEEGYHVVWENTGLCMIQISAGRTVWVLNMNRIKVGLLTDVAVVWEDLRIDMQQLVDVGLMAKLWNPEAHPDDGFQNLALDVAAKEILEVTVDKSRQKTTDWKKEPSDEEIIYAGIDAAVSVRLYDKLALGLNVKESSIGKKIPSTWYTYNMTEGEVTRIENSYRGNVILWTQRDCSWYTGGKFQGYFP
ncbi:hypothetical protein C8R44DRAFT_747890 [Mycena epipterygia]|nr:hypothetical protein C8R44DRAFT_747890 [Mycena epipterygia]